jgi:hypothetical protein
VAIVQISRITNRKGLAVDLPQPLAGAELGWVVDERRLFIGNGTLEEGAPVVGNTEVLTEFSDILSFADQYTYQGTAAGYTVQTGPTPGSPITQSLQDRLDSFVIVTDFGATGDGVTDDTAAINRALYQLYCVQNNTQTRRGLFFPAGTYIVTDTIKVPSFAKLYGEGLEGSIISFNVQNWAANTAYASGVLIYNTSNTTYYRSIAPVPATGISVTDITYWTSTTLPTYVMRTADSMQQTGANIATNGATPPQNIDVSEISIVTNKLNNGLLVEKANQCVFHVNIAGPLTTADLTVTTANTLAVDFASTPSLPCTQIEFEGFAFSGFTWGVNTAQQIASAVFTAGSFDTLYQGILLGGASLSNGGAQGVRVTNNIFDNIYEEGVYFYGVNMNATGYNIFYDVGNHFNGAGNPASSVMTIDSISNVSLGDMFERSLAQAATYPRIKLYNTTTGTIPAAIAIDNSAQIQMGSFIRETGQQATITAGATNTTLFTVNTVFIKAFRMEYTIVVDTSVRTGTLTIVNDPDDSAGDTLQSVDDYVENSHTDVTLAVTDVAGTITVSYAAGRAGLIYYSLTHLGRST